MRRIAVSIQGRTCEEIIEHTKQIVKRAEKLEKKYADSDVRVDILEFRADYYENICMKEELIPLLQEIKKIIGKRNLLFTFRSEEEGGELRHDRAGFMLEDIYSWVIAGKLADMVDVELMSGNYRVARFCTKCHDAGMKIVLSYHNYEETPRDDRLMEMFHNMETLGGDVLKIAVTPKKELDVKRLIELEDKIISHGFKEEKDNLNKPVVMISMGKKGRPSRLKVGDKGSYFTFGFVGELSAPGQIEIETLFEELAADIPAPTVKKAEKTK